MKSVKENWRAFGGAIGDPWSIIFLIFTLALIAAAIWQGKVGNGTHVVYSALLHLTLTASSVVLGIRLTTRWVDQTESGILVVRGKAAIRNLKLLMHNIVVLGSRVRLFAQMMTENSRSLKVITARNYEEIVSKCDSLAEEAVNSIENWTDIIPDANIRTQIGDFTKLRGELNRKEGDLAKLQKVIKEAKDQSNEEKARVKNEIAARESVIQKLRADLEILEVKLSLPLFDSTGLSPKLVVPWAQVSTHTGLMPPPVTDPETGDLAALYGEIVQTPIKPRIISEPETADEED